MLVDGRWAPTFPRARYLIGRQLLQHELLGKKHLPQSPRYHAKQEYGLCLIGVYISARSSSSVSASSGGLSGRYRFTRANRSATPPG